MRVTEHKVYSSSDIPFSIEEIEPRKEPGKVLVASPEHFNIIDIKNPHMAGNEGKLDKALALRQWNSLKDCYRSLVHKGILEAFYEIPGAASCEDMVFAANQSFPWLDEKGLKRVILSKMRHPSRQREVPFFKDFYKKIGYDIIELKKAQLFEGMGDTIPHPGSRLLYGGYGHRSEEKAYSEINQLLNVPIVLLELVNDKFYHLDTCFLPLDEKSVMIYEGAFSAEGIKTIRKLFKEVLSVPLEEAEKGFALNAHLINLGPDKKTAIIHPGNRFTNNVLKTKGFNIIEIDTSEFIKSGGSIFCMKMMLY